MNKRIALSLIATLCLTASVIAQKINITLPDQANKEFAFVLHKGIKKDTIKTGTLNFLGNTIIQIPESEKNYVGMGTLEIKDSPATNLIINHENFSAESTKNGFVFKNSKENNYFYAFIQQEQKPEIDNSLYAQSFLDMVTYMSKLNNAVYKGSDMQERAQIRIYAQNSLNMEDLYTSSIWMSIVDGIMKLSNSEEAYVATTIKMINRIKSEEVLKHFTENMILITQQYGMEEAFEGIISYMKESGRIEFPEGEIYDAFESLKVLTGDIAPKVVGLKGDYKEPYDKLLLVFYDPDCVSCEYQMKLLKERYSELKEKKVRVVSISSEHDEAKFPENSKDFPWSDKLVDFKGYSGANYMNYGIMGTPTFMLLDKNNKLIKKNAQLSNFDFDH